MSISGGALLGDIRIHAVSNRGFSPEELAEIAVEKIIYVGKDAHPAIKEQAEVFKAQIRHVLLDSLRQAVRSHNTTIANRLRQAGHPELVAILES